MGWEIVFPVAFILVLEESHDRVVRGASSIALWRKAILDAARNMDHAFPDGIHAH